MPCYLRGIELFLPGNILYPSLKSLYKQVAIILIECHIKKRSPGQFTITSVNWDERSQVASGLHLDSLRKFLDSQSLKRTTDTMVMAIAAMRNDVSVSL
jgi:hypothetical protein